jgi:hypothetical protein
LSRFAEDLKILTRSSLLSVALILAIGLVVAKTYWLWTSGPWDLPTPGKPKSPVLVDGSNPDAKPPAVISTELIISRNLFDPERGAGFTREVEANSQSFQRIKSMVLLGTAILGSNRFAILQDGAMAPATKGQAVAPMRIKLGDTVEGFKLSEISEKRVVFTKGNATVDVALDYFRKSEIAQPRAPATAPAAAPGQAGTPRVATPGPTSPPGQPVPRVVPALPRRERLVAPGASPDR